MCNRAKGTWPLHRVADNKLDWNEFVKPLTYAYHTQVHKFPGMSLFSEKFFVNPQGRQRSTDVVYPQATHTSFQNVRPRRCYGCTVEANKHVVVLSAGAIQE